MCEWRVIHSQYHHLQLNLVVQIMKAIQNNIHTPGGKVCVTTILGVMTFLQPTSN